MSEDKDGEFKPLNFKGKLSKPALHRPRRATRKALTYTESPAKAGSEEKIAGDGTMERGAERWLVRREIGEREARGQSIESIWGGSASDSTDTLECWSPRTVERRTGVLLEGVKQLKTQIQQIQMAKKEEMSMGDLLKMMMEINSKQDAERDKREERMAEESRHRIEKMAEDARIREEEREERALVREEKRIEEARLREEDRRVQAEERERKMVVALKETRPIVESVKLPTMEKGMDIESFLELFQTALTVAKIPEDKWITRLHMALDSDTKLLVREVFLNPDSTFEEAKLALTGQTHIICRFLRRQR